MSTHLRDTTLALVFAAILLAGCATRQPSGPEVAAAPPKPYLRVARETNGTVTLETAARMFQPPSKRGPAVCLVGVTHLGTASYYSALQGLLNRQACVLFEGVGATNKQFRKRIEGQFHLQDALARALGLEFQLNAIDYSPSHFRNSDLTPAQIHELLGAAAAEDDPDAEVDPGNEFNQLLSVMEGSGLFGGLARMGVGFLAASPRLQVVTKVMLIELLSEVSADMQELAAGAPGLQRLLEVLIERRDEVVIRDIRAAVAAQRKPYGGVAVFYGAGHMSDLEERLRSELGYKPAEDSWFPAFSANPGEAGLSERETEWLRRLLRSQMQGLRPSKTGSR